MDKEIRNAIDRATQKSRKLLEEDFAEQLEGTFDVLQDGNIASKAGAHLSPTQAILRDKIIAAIAHKRATGMDKAAAIADYLRDAAFTTLNRFVALKMLEARELVQECITKGEQSAGYREFCGMAPGVALLPDSAGYRLYIESLFDELSTEVKVLFNRRDAASLLWPKRTCFEELLAVLNVPELSRVWREDETIGWIYQYYNGNDVGEMRKAANGGAPRNSRELAVRNQFFTPRYVVEFLTDNTLGRLWYEMTKGETNLSDCCSYLVRRPIEIFLDEDESAPAMVANSEAKAGENFSQEELLQHPFYIPYRPIKDPREIRLLDPACGSMHFGLYAFDLFTVIYDEAWEIVHGPDEANKSVKTFVPFISYLASFTDKAAFLREIPRIIIENNIHGIDIDPRATQIAGLSLWLRAQRDWHQAGVKTADRPRITRSNLVCAEPMPGEKELLHEFIEQQFPVTEQPAFAFLMGKIFDCMALAGEAGSLLRIEAEICTAIAEARALSLRQSAPRQNRLFPGDKQPEQLGLDLSNLNDEQFWQTAEQRIYDALEAYAEQAENGGYFQRRLFAADAAQGFAFIDLCRKRYDVVVMNPPFGEASEVTQPYLQTWYPEWNYNLFCCFVSRALDTADFVGAITDRAYMLKTSYEEFRRKWSLGPHRLAKLVDLGWGILDANVEVNLQVYQPDSQRVDIIDLSDLGDQRSDSLKNACLKSSSEDWITRGHDYFLDLPNAVISYQLPAWQEQARKQGKNISDVFATAKSGLKAGRVEQFVRALWEVPEASRGTKKHWNYFQNGSPYAPYYYPTTWVLWYETNWQHIKAVPSSRITGLEDYWRPGLSYGKRTDYIYCYPMPEGQVFSNEGMAVFPNDFADIYTLMGFVNSPSCQSLMNLLAGQHKAHSYFNKMCLLTPVRDKQVSDSAHSIVKLLSAVDRLNEISLGFISPYSDQTIAITSSPIDSTVAFIKRALEEAQVSFGSIAKRVALLVGDHEEVKPKLPDWVELLYGFPLGSYLIELNAISYCLGAAFGRWDIRYAMGDKTMPELPDPLAPLPVCQPGMLQDYKGLPLSPEEGRRQLQADGHYPLDVAWDGILVDDPEHPLDIERRIHDALAVLWGDRIDELVYEACELLGVSTLREWFRRPSGFFAAHLKRYSKSRRQAPIYWQLSTGSGSYSVWLYYHRFSKDTLYKVLEHVKQKVLHEERKSARLTYEAGGSPSTAQRKDLATQEQFVSELRVFHEELASVIPLWNPDLNDGVIINYGPMWRMIAHKPWQKTVKASWDELAAGNYDWAHLAMHLWPERVVPKCAFDRSLAIAHGLEEIFWEEDDKGKRMARPTPVRSIEELVRERSSPAVKDALKNLLDSPTVKASKASTRSRSGR